MRKIAFNPDSTKPTNKVISQKKKKKKKKKKKVLDPTWSRAFNKTPSWLSHSVRRHKFVRVEKKLSLRTISSYNGAYFLQKYKSLSINLVTLIAHVLTKMKNLFVIRYTLIFGQENMNDSKNANIVKTTVEYILSTESFNICLFE